MTSLMELYENYVVDDTLDEDQAEENVASQALNEPLPVTDAAKSKTNVVNDRKSRNYFHNIT